MKVKDWETGRPGDWGKKANSRSPGPPVPQSLPPGTLRSIAAEDFEALYLLDQACFEPGIAYSRAELHRFLRLPGADGVVCERDGAIAGFAIGYVSERAAHVVTLDVAGNQRRRGIGKALLGELLRRFGKEGACEARLEVAVENYGAIAFYEGVGFRRRRRIPDYYGGGRHAYEMGKKL
jgi:ribosomal-protein-alanine N-acetyltransferase